MEMSPFQASVQQARVDAIQAEARREETKRHLFRPPPEAEAPLVRSTDLLCLRVAEELQYARRLLDLTGEALLDDPIILARHSQSLQNFDLLAQLMGHLAQVIESEDKALAVSRIGMQELRTRLERKALHAV